MTVKAKNTITLTRVDDGTQGPQGPSGKTTYFHIKYSSVSKPTSASQMTETPSTYIGTYVDFTQADSTDPTKYTWSRFVGAQGAKGDQGIPGVNGANGQTSYLHIAYANSADGKTGFSVSDSVGKLYIGQYTDFVSSDSTDYKKYSWTKIKGDTGAQGPQGPTGATGVGVSSIDVLYYLSSSATSLVGGAWSTTAPSWVSGKYIWSKTVTKLTNGTTKESSPACITGEKGPTGNTGAQGPTGSTGTGITSITEEYYLSTSKTTQTGGSWKTTPPAWLPNHYMWTRSKIVYKNPTSTAYTSPVCDSSWEAVNEVQVGGRNLILNSTFKNYKGNNFYTFNGDEVKFSTNTPVNGNNSPNDGYRIGLSTGDYFLKTIRGKTLTISMDYYIEKTISYGTVHPFIGLELSLSRNSTTGGENQYLDWYGGISFPTAITGKWIRYSTCVNVSDHDISGYGIWIYVRDATGTVKFRHPKIEIGNKATDWTPAPEDVQDEIDLLKTEYKADFKVLGDRVTSNVNATNALGTRTNTLEQTADKLSSKITGLEGDVSTLEQTSSGLSVRLDNAEKNINGIEIGGTNLILNGNFDRQGSDWVISNPSKVQYLTGGLDNTLFVKQLGALKETCYLENVKHIDIKVGETYTMSGYYCTINVVSGSTNYFVRPYISLYDKNNTWLYDISITIEKNTQVWTRFSHTFTIPNISNVHHMVFRLYSRDYTGSVSWDRIKLEKGNKATDWTSAPEDTVIGNRNYVPNGNFAETYTSPGQTDKHANLYPYLWGGYNGGITDPTHSYHAHINNNTFGYNTVIFNEVDGNKSWKGIACYSGSNSDDKFKIEKVEKYYRISVDVYATGVGTKLFGGFYYYKKGGTSQAFHAGQYTIYPQETSKWVRMSAHVPLNEDIDLSKEYAFYIYGYGFSTSSILYIKNVSLTNSTVTTDWTPSKEEVDKGIENAAKTATNYLDFSSAGLLVGNMTAATLNKNILISNDAIDFRNGTTVLGKMSPSTIMLGPTTTNNILIDANSINFRNGTNIIGRILPSSITLGPTTTTNALIQTDGFYIRNKYAVLSSFKDSLIELGKNSTQSVIKLCGGIGEIKAINYEELWDGLSITSECLGLSGNNIYLTSSNKSASSQISTSIFGDTPQINLTIHDYARDQHNEFIMQSTIGLISSPLIINGTKFTGVNKVLWSGALYMIASHSATLTETINEQTNGIVIVFSSYTNGAADDYNWIQCFVPKKNTAYNKGGGHGFLLVNNNFSLIAAKYLYINDTSIRGHDDNTLIGTKNGVTYANNRYVMRYVIGV